MVQVVGIGCAGHRMLRAILDFGQSILDEVSLTIRRENHVWLGVLGKGNIAAHYFGLG